MAGDCFAAFVAIFEMADDAAGYYMVIGAVLGVSVGDMHERGLTIFLRHSTQVAGGL